MDSDAASAARAAPSAARCQLDAVSQLLEPGLLLCDNIHQDPHQMEGLASDKEDPSVRVPDKDLHAQQSASCGTHQSRELADGQPSSLSSNDAFQRGRKLSNSRSAISKSAVAPMPTRPQASASQADPVQPPLMLRGWPLYSHLRGSKRDRRSNSGSGDADESDLSEDDDDDDDDGGEAGRASKSSRLSITEWRASMRTDANTSDITNVVRSGDVVCASAVAPLTIGMGNQITDKPPPLDGSAVTAGAGAKSNKTGGKTSRYLREMDRRDIITRIDQGEKQAALAKEYNISRSAVCNLHKKRQQVLARAHASPFAKHPKVSRVIAARAAAFPLEDATPAFAPPSTFTMNTLASSSPGDVAFALGEAKYESGLHLLAARAAELLLRSVLDPATQASDFRRYTDRLTRLVLEEALAQIRLITVSLLNGVSSYGGVATARPVCAISMEQRACLMLDHFMLLEPKSPTGYARFSQSSTVGETQGGASEENTKQQQVTVNILQAHLPANLAQHDVLLLETVVESGDAVCLAIDEVLRLSAPASDDGAAMYNPQIAVATLFISSEAVEVIARRHPHVRIVAADCELLCGTRAMTFRTRFEHETTSH